jgi:hypothetical protein
MGQRINKLGDALWVKRNLTWELAIAVYCVSQNQYNSQNKNAGKILHTRKILVNKQVNSDA